MGQTSRSWLRGGQRSKNVGQDNEISHDDVKRQIDSDQNNSKQIYQLVNVKTGGGKLIDIIKSRARHHSLHSSLSASLDKSEQDLAGTRNQRRSTGKVVTDQKVFQDYDQAVDEQIHKLVKPLLYDGGRGKLVPLARIWQCRFAGGCATSDHDDSFERNELQKGNKSSLLSPSPLSSDGPQRQQQSQTTSSASPNNNVNFRWVCWRLDERGFVGETALHICFLLSTPTHMILAQKLLRLFPMLINDIYTCDQYFGESSLHMAIVNEDVRILKLLLDHGANVHERCLGSFFLPDDQKDKANGQIRRRLADIKSPNQTSSGASDGVDFVKSYSNPISFGFDLHSNQLSDLQTNYEGYTYWGEYPLSFAASLGLADCYKLLQAKGADPNLVDSNGNSTLHICVIANRLDMFDLCYSNGANLGCLNKLGFSPLTLAAKLRRVEMFFHILTIMRQVNWIFCNVGFVDIPLDEIDSIDTRDGSCNDQSVLSIVVSGNSNEHLKMLDGLLSDLLRVKWETSIRGIFRTRLMLFILFLIITSVAYLTRLDIGRASRLIQSSNSTTIHNGNSHRNVLEAARSYKLANEYSEILVVCCVLYYLSTLTKCCLVESTYFASSKPNVTRSSRSGPLQILAQAPELIIFTFTCLLIAMCIPLRLVVKWRESEDFLIAIIMFLMPLKLLFFCRGSKSLGSFIVMIYKILVNDVLCFVVFLIIFIAGFGQSFVIIFKTYKMDSVARKNLATLNKTSNFFESLVAENGSYFLNFYDSFITLHMMALNEFSWVVDEFKSTEFPNLARVLFCIYMILVSILLVNMLIAMLGKTYQDIASQPNENLRQWARALLTVERLCSRKTRLRMLNRYSIEKRRESVASGGPNPASGRRGMESSLCRCYSSTWALSEADAREIEAIKRLISEHQISAHRLAERQNRVC